MRHPSPRPCLLGALALLPALMLPRTPAAFETLAVFLERNVQDRDAEIHFEVVGAQDGLTRLTVTRPGGGRVLNLEAAGSKLGFRGVILESPEPDDASRVTAAFPAGAYSFEATTTAGAKLQGTARLVHAFPAAATLEAPQAGQRDVPPTGLVLRWSAESDLASCAVTLEQTGSPFVIRAMLPGTARAFAVPDGFLRPGQSYSVAIGTVAKDGNRSFVETTFVTAADRRAETRSGTERPPAGPQQEGASK
ncbi:MAG TPA: hypothetical protein VE650_13015 [Acetobacteraceae bacterium]|nr:hypothetical protein [Acetobacteraceae bacterium]